MKRVIGFFAVLFPLCCMAQFDKYFEQATLRIDYSHSGRVGVEYFNIERFFENPRLGRQ